MSSQRSTSMEPSPDNIRKRVCKACDRCRLKKSKCDGASPCSRCKADNAICVFGERKKSQDKVYPKGYVEMLEQQQAQLVAGLRELYSRIQDGRGWPGRPLREAHGGHPLTHDILERLDLLHASNDGSPNYERFEDEPCKMQQILLDRGAQLTHRRHSVSSEEEHGNISSGSSNGGSPTDQKPIYADTFTRNQAPPTPPMNSPFPRQSQIGPVKQSAPVFQTVTNPGTLESTRSTWMEPMVMDDLYFENPFNPAFDTNPPMFEPFNMANPAPTMWSEEQLDSCFNNFTTGLVSST